MKASARSNAWIAVVALGVVALWALWHVYLLPQRQGETRNDHGTFVVMRTPGGLLEISKLRRVEELTRTETLSIAGFAVGRTVSRIEVPVVYQYQLPLAKEWLILIVDRTCIVQTPEVVLSLPVAVDTSAMRLETRSGWLLFDGQENLQTLLRQMSAELEAQGRKPANLALVAEDARRTVSEFTAKWSPDPRCRANSGFERRVVLPGESLLPSRPAPDRQSG